MNDLLFIKKHFSFRKKKKISIEYGEITKKSYSNLALIKYWGKHRNKIQIPFNSSISFLLKKLYTITKIIFFRKKNKFSVRLFFSGKENHSFLPKILKFFDRISSYCSYIKNLNFIIETKNTFPHSSGMASSASSMSSLALCIMEIEKEIFSLKKDFFLRKASFLSRLGSGSACRSIYSGFSVWGYHQLIKGSNNLYSIPYPYQIHPIFIKIMDTVLVINQNPKKLSSSKGHYLMNNHPYSRSRFKQANKNMEKIISILKMGDFQEFGKLIENEALHLHAMIMTSNPYFLYMAPNTLHVIYKVLDFRKQSNKNIYFTLDAGSNVHLLYPNQEKKVILKWIYDHLFDFCEKIFESSSL